jgi:predicted nucleic acid-binding protein
MGMSRIFWDTNLFIYLFEDYGQFSKLTLALRNSMLIRGDQLFTSSLTLGELLVKPLERKDRALCGQYEAALSAAALVLPFDTNAARVYASLRSDRSLRAPDVIQLSCAAAAGVDLFITNDERLQRKRVQGIHFISSLERAPI